MRVGIRSNAVARAAACTLAALFPACYQGSQPLTPAASGGTDARLDGEWRCLRDDGDDVVRLSVHARSTSQHDVSLRAPGEDADHYIAHVSKVGDVDIANVQEPDGGQATRKWVYVRYRFLREGLLDLGLVAEDRLAHATDPQAALDEIRARAADDRIYEHLLVCLRARPPR